MSIQAFSGDYLGFRRFDTFSGGAVMKYPMLIYTREALAGMSKADSDAFMGEYFTFTEA